MQLVKYPLFDIAIFIINIIPNILLKYNTYDVAYIQIIKILLILFAMYSFQITEKLQRDKGPTNP